MTALRLGILFSTTGAYGMLGRDCRDGAMTAIEDLRGEGSIAIEPVAGDPAASSERYIELARRMLQEDGCRHVIGTVTSQARKDVIPVVEKHDAQLWYVCPYEGFEANPNVIYTGACPNQHLLPLFEHMLPTFGRRVYLAGANYIWGWEMNRLAREVVIEAGGEIVGERCLPIGDTDVDRILAEVAARRPDFILSNMLGPSNHAFLRAMQALGRRDPAFRPERCPVVSCDLTECELPEIGLGAADGQLAAASYFHALDTPANRALKARVAARFGSERRVSSYFATSYATVRLCVEAVTSLRNRRSYESPSRPPRPGGTESRRAAAHRPGHKSRQSAVPARSHIGSGLHHPSVTPERCRRPLPDPPADRPSFARRAAAAQDRVMKATPSFLGQRAVILHRPGETTDRLVRQCALLGFRAEARWQPLRDVAGVDIVLVDADEGWDGLLPWTPCEKPVPLVALLASEAPGRIAWALDQGADALIAKPVTASAVYPALVMATRRHAEARQLARRMERLEERVRLRPLVHAAVRTFMAAEDCGEDEAYGRLRREAMRKRLTLEQAAASILGSPRREAG